MGFLDRFKPKQTEPLFPGHNLFEYPDTQFGDTKLRINDDPQQPILYAPNWNGDKPLYFSPAKDTTIDVQDFGPRKTSSSRAVVGQVFNWNGEGFTPISLPSNLPGQAVITTTYSPGARKKSSYLDVRS